MEEKNNHRTEATDKRVLIRIKFMNQIKFCEIHPTNFTMKSFVRDGELPNHINPHN